MIPEETKPELADDSFEEMKTITIHAIRNGSKQYSNETVGKFEDFSSRTIELEVDDRGWVPIPDERQDGSVSPMCVENGTCQIEKMDYQCAPQQDKFLSVDLNSDEGELGTLKSAVSKLSHIFWEQEEKLKNFKHKDKKAGVNNFQAEDVRDLYLDMLKEMSQQLGELCHDLHTDEVLINSLEATRREADEQQCRVTELISINEDLIAFSESKEDEITGLKMTIESLQQCVDEKSAEAAQLSAEALAFSQEVVEAREEGEAYRLHCTALKSKLEELEDELIAQEASAERLTQHLLRTIEGQDSILEEKEQLLLSLYSAQYKEHRLDGQVRQSEIIIQDLEEKLNSMDAEVNEALEMAEMKAKGLEALHMEQQAGEMKNRVYEIDEEMMEEEGQFSILNSSYPWEYTQTF